MTFEHDLKEKTKVFEAHLPKLSGQGNAAQQLIEEAMLYSLLAGGKRLRPILLLETCNALHVAPDVAMPFALALEMIHTYSLIHDDLPCMDDDDLRRGKPTNHVVFGYDIAVLAGDALLNSAAELMAKAVVERPQTAKAMYEILLASGSKGMVLGQVADMTFSSEEMTREKLDYINEHKTGKLFTAALVSGGLIGNASEKDIQTLSQVGYYMGLIFQMVDDVLDMTGNEEKLGKRTQMDAKNDKITYPMLIGIEETEKRIQDYYHKTHALINTLAFDFPFLKSVLAFFITRDH